MSDSAEVQYLDGSEAARAAGGSGGPCGRGAQEPSRRVGAGRWWTAVAAGSVLAVPFGVLLSYVAFLVAMLGLFFYVLFGLFIGATTYRIAAAARPVTRGALVAGAAVIVGVGWGTSLAWEIHAFPDAVAGLAVKKTAFLPAGKTKAEFVAAIHARLEAYLAERYPPGGAAGYARWMIDGGRFPRGTFAGVNVDLGLAQRGAIWVVRLVLSLSLLTFGVASQLWPLARPADAAKPPATSRLMSGI